MKIIQGILLLILFSACADVQDEIKDLRDPETVTEQEPSETKTPENTTDIQSNTKEIETVTEKSEWSYEVVLISENNWGYQLFQSGKMIINQTSIPSVQGIDGFDSKEKADRTANYLIKNKLENGIFPPTVNKEELENLGVLRD